MSWIRTSCISITLVVLMGCSESGNAFRDQFRWLSGKWKGANDGIELIEQWKWNKSRFEGIAFEIKDGDTLLTEHLFLEEFNGIPGYVAIVNGNGPFMFAFKSQKNRMVEFQNEEHDFPSIVRYQKDSDTSMTITLVSNEIPKPSIVSYQLKRIQR